MARNRFLPLVSVFFLIFISLELVSSADNEQQKQIYIVYLGATPPQRERESPSAYYSGILEGIGISKESLVRSYGKSFGGFAAFITKKQQKTLAAHNEVISVFPSRKLQLLTTESWDFMGFPINVSRNPTTESDIIVGLLDTGIWHTSASFRDNGFGPPPKKWKGACNGGKNFTCNNKIIGAKVYVENSALDTHGHGTHTASIAAGNEVHNASFFGVANGTARGAVPSARIAVYKVCTANGCEEHDILSAFDDAISDGVDILSVSVGDDIAKGFLEDSIAIGGLHAFANGILTVQAAGNSASYGMTSSVAPWLFSVAAGTTSRKLMSKVQLGNGSEEYGYSINSFNLEGKKYPLIDGKNASQARCRGDTLLESTCGCLDTQKVQGKIVICDGIEFNTVGIYSADAIGAITLAPTKKTVMSRIVSVPASRLRVDDFELVQDYYRSTKNPEATIFKSESINEIAPVVASFSSRGPNRILPDILKPDITAPGVYILAAYSPVVSPSGDVTDTRSTPFSILSGTSMACPHIAGAAAYVKSNRPNWSPSAIKSALMTTAKQMNANQSGDGNMEFSFGSGFLDPTKALNPGLVYETTTMDYLKLLCNSGFDNKTIGKMFGDNTTCPKRDASTPRDLNYPTMAAKLNQSDIFSVKFPRTVTNIGQANATYKATFSQIPQINITVEPSVLSFKELNEKQSFVVSISGSSIEKMISVSLEWSDGIHIVRSPIVIYTTEY